MMSDSSEKNAKPRTSGHVWMDHTSEVGVRIHAPDLPELVAEAARAFAGLVPEHRVGTESPEHRSFRLDGGDATATLVGWLNELVYLAEVDRWIPSEVVAAREDEAIRVTARGRVLDRPFVLVKAATLHGPGVRTTEGGLEAEVTLDI